MQLSNNAIKYIENISRERYPNEAVFGIISEDSVVELSNIHEDPVNHFKIDSQEFYDKECIALVHSHTVKRGDKGHSEMYIDPRSPSECDLNVQAQMDCQWGILALDEDSILPIIWFPDLDSPIVGQPYISGVSDCLTVVQKYYKQNYNIDIPTIPHAPTWFETNPNMYMEHYSDYGFKESSIDNIEQGDLILIRLFHDTPTHGAIYTGNGKIVHHLANKLSTEEDLFKWQKRIVMVLTHDKVKQ